MASQTFRALAIGDAFRLDGRVYQKRSKYSALLIQLESGELPRMKINRMMNPSTAVESATEFVESK